MELFLFYVMLFLKALKYLFPFIVGGFFAILAYYILGKPPLLIFFPVAVIVVAFVASELVLTYKMLHK